VTLVVSPQEAEAIHVASTAGRPWMVLRAPGDNASNHSVGVTLAALRGNARMEHGKEGALGGNNTALAKLNGAPATQPIASAKKPGRTLTFIRGGKTESITIEADGETARSTTPVSPATPVEKPAQPLRPEPSNPTVTGGAIEVAPAIPQ
jgi:hypothetical protein